MALKQTQNLRRIRVFTDSIVLPQYPTINHSDKEMPTGKGSNCPVKESQTLYNGTWHSMFPETF